MRSGVFRSLPGLTMLELLVAIALLGMFVVSSGHLLRTAMLLERQLRSGADREWLHERLRAAFLADLIAADPDSIVLTDDGVAMRTLSALPPELPAWREVRWGVEDMGVTALGSVHRRSGEMMLIRRSLTVGEDGEIASERIIAHGIGLWLVEVPEEAQGDPASFGSPVVVVIRYDLDGQERRIGWRSAQ